MALSTPFDEAKLLEENEDYLRGALSVVRIVVHRPAATSDADAGAAAGAEKHPGASAVPGKPAVVVSHDASLMA